ncbi:MAG: translation initiation factor IF-3, partial [bacterium]
HDYDYKVRNARRFLEHGDKVKFVVQFRGREIAHKDLGKVVVDRVAEDLADCGQVETSVRQEGRLLTMVMAPLIGSLHKKKRETDEETSQGTLEPMEDEQSSLEDDSEDAIDDDPDDPEDDATQEEEEAVS